MHLELYQVINNYIKIRYGINIPVFNKLSCQLNGHFSQRTSVWMTYYKHFRHAIPLNRFVIHERGATHKAKNCSRNTIVCCLLTLCYATHNNLNCNELKLGHDNDNQDITLIRTPDCIPVRVYQDAYLTLHYSRLGFQIVQRGGCQWDPVRGQ